MNIQKVRGIQVNGQDDLCFPTPLNVKLKKVEDGFSGPLTFDLLHSRS